jgi:Flp pilus assembly protein TadD
MSKLSHVLFREYSSNDNEILDEALELAKKAVEIEPKDSENQLLLGKLYDKRGMTPEAIEAFNAAIKLQAEA